MRVKESENLTKKLLAEIMEQRYLKGAKGKKYPWDIRLQDRLGPVSLERRSKPHP